MQVRRWLRCAVVCLLCGTALIAPTQKNRREPLTEAQQDQLAEAGIAPFARIGLYAKFVNEHVSRLEAIGKRSEAGRGQRLAEELGDLSELLDELASNLDQYGGRKADLRKGLNSLKEAVPKWQAILRGLPADRADDIELKDAREALDDLADQVKDLSGSQDKYFEEHKDRKWQDREEPE